MMVFCLCRIVEVLGVGGVAGLCCQTSACFITKVCNYGLLYLRLCLIKKEVQGVWRSLPTFYSFGICSEAIEKNGETNRKLPVFKKLIMWSFNAWRYPDY